MSEYKISKKRLAQIIKEEYQSIHEFDDQEDYQSPEIGQSLQGGDERRSAERSDLINTVLELAGSDLGRLQDTITWFVMRAGQVDVDEFLHGAGVGGYPGAEAEPYSRKDESLDSIRDLIKQELAKL
tara:strand:+ start:87 stop:467 length:381 start_codon:yes stop_codon:yes gene_type:complete